MEEFVQLLVNGLVTGSIIAIGAIGLTLVYGILRIVNFAHGDYLTFGAYMAFIANVTLFDLNMVLAAAFAMGTAAGLGVMIDYLLWRPMRKKRAGLISLFITSIGVALVLRHLLFIWFGASSRRFDVNVFQVFEIGFINLSQSQIISVVVASGAIVLVGLTLAKTKIGKGMRAVSDDPALAAVAGIDVDRITLYTWILSSALAGLAGVLQGLVQNAFNPNMGFSLLLPIFAAVILGGVGSAYGALAGGIALGVAMELSTWDVFVGGVPHVYKIVVAFCVLILVLIVRPQGVFGRARIV
jgi:branched-subunit amino acid ABC-type transport system permease component